MTRIRIEPVVHPDFVLDAEQMEKAKDVVDEVRRVWREKEAELLRNLWPVDPAGPSASKTVVIERNATGGISYLAEVKA